MGTGLKTGLNTEATTIRPIRHNLVFMLERESGDVMQKARVVIVGASGYSGAELVSLLLGHPRAEIVGLFGSAKREADGKSEPFSVSWPRFRGRLDLPVRAASVPGILELNPDAVFLCTPHEASLDLAPQLLNAARSSSAPSSPGNNASGPTVLDLSAAFRIKDAAAYPAYYGFEHTQPELLASAIFGLPELFRASLPGAKLVAVPGCYPTSAILPLAPLVKAGAIRSDAGMVRRPIIDSVSGISGAGRKAEQRLLFCEVSSQAYGVFKHRHQPEIDAYAGVPTVFTPHLGPFDRGILSTIHIDLAPGWNAEKIGATLRAAYGNEPFVRLCPSGVWPAIADIRHTNFCDIGFAVDEKHGHAIISSAIDNLTKGAAGQAVQAMNAVMGFPETLALLNGGSERL